MSQADADDFLRRIELVSQSVKDIKDGKLDSAGVEKIAKKLKTREQKQAEKKEKERLEELKQWESGRPGKGAKTDYDWFCRACFLEFKGEKRECFKCNKELIS